jgi:hypothetical protein
MHYHSDADVEQLAHGFTTHTLPREQWTHEAHFVVGLWHVRTFGVESAIERMREKIKGYNLACGVENTESSGYHETLTLLYLRAIADFCHRQNADAATPLHTLANALTQDVIIEKSFPLEHYSRERLFSPQARAVWTEPDVKPFSW